MCISSNMSEIKILCTEHCKFKNKSKKVFRFIFDFFFGVGLFCLHVKRSTHLQRQMFKWKQKTKLFYFPALLNMYEDLWIKHTDCSLCNSSASMSLEHERWLGRKKWEWFGGQKDFQDSQILLETCLPVFFK